MSRRNPSLIFVVAALLVLTACQSSASGEPSGEPSGAAASPPSRWRRRSRSSSASRTRISLRQPQVACGAEVIKDEVEAADVGFTIEIFGAEPARPGRRADPLGRRRRHRHGHPGRIGAERRLRTDERRRRRVRVRRQRAHVPASSPSEASDALKQGFEEETGVHILGAWNTGARQFTANKPIRTPADLEGLRMRFPPSPQFLMNAAAMGASPSRSPSRSSTSPSSRARSTARRTRSRTSRPSTCPRSRPTSACRATSSARTSSSSARSGTSSARTSRRRSRPRSTRPWSKSRCASWRPRTRSSTSGETGGAMEIVDDVDREAFRAKAEPYLRENFTPEQVEVLDAIRSTAE